MVAIVGKPRPYYVGRGLHLDIPMPKMYRDGTERVSRIAATRATDRDSPW
jgi:hypothetical protein